MDEDILKITVECSGKKATFEAPHTGAWDDLAEVFRAIGIWLTFAPETVFNNIFRSDEPYPGETDEDQN